MYGVDSSCLSGIMVSSDTTPVRIALIAVFAQSTEPRASCLRPRITSCKISQSTLREFGPVRIMNELSGTDCQTLSIRWCVIAGLALILLTAGQRAKRSRKAFVEEQEKREGNQRQVRVFW